MQADRNFDGSGFRNIRCLTKMGVEFHEEKGSDKPLTRSIKHRDKLQKLLELKATGQIETIGPVQVSFKKWLKIGEGSYGTCVYVGLLNDGREVAVKRLLTDRSEHFYLNNEHALLTIQKVKKSEHIVKCRYFKVDNPFSYLVTDLCEGTLADYVKLHSKEHLENHGPVMIKEILTGLYALHCGGEKILHMDLKPENILVDARGKMCLADFGISRRLTPDQTTLHTGTKGTAGWRAAESLVDLNPKYKRKSDIQVIGMICFYILTKGRHPFGGCHYREANILCGNPVDLEMLADPIARDFVSQLISHDINKRPYVEEALKHPYLNATIPVSGSTQESLSSSSGKPFSSPPTKRKKDQEDY